MTMTFIKNAFTRDGVRYEARTYGLDVAAATPGRHRLVGIDGVYLDVRKPGVSASWLFYYYWQGLQPELGLGSALDRDGNVVFAGEAKRKGLKFAAMLADGENPQTEKRSSMTFGQCLEAVIAREQKSRPTWGEAGTWRRYGKNWFPGLMNLKPSQVDRHRVAEQLGKRRDDAGTTSDRARHVIFQVMDYARDIEICGFEINPAEKRLIDNILGSRVSTEQEEHASVPYTEAQAFAAKCLAPKSSHWRLMGNARKALMVAASIPHRSAEVYKMKRADVNLVTGVWVTPAEDNKKEHAQINVMPWQVVEILRSIPEVPGNPYFFAGGTAKEPSATKHIEAGRMRDILQEEMGITGLSNGKREPATVHGFRSTIVTYAGEKRGVARQTMKDMLSHRPEKKSKKKEALDHYYRPENVVARRDELQAFADFMFPADFVEANVVRLPLSIAQIEAIVAEARAA